MSEMIDVFYHLMVPEKSFIFFSVSSMILQELSVNLSLWTFQGIMIHSHIQLKDPWSRKVLDNPKDVRAI